MSQVMVGHRKEKDSRDICVLFGAVGEFTKICTIKSRFLNKFLNKMDLQNYGVSLGLCSLIYN